jgi:hypothetical protein
MKLISKLAITSAVFALAFISTANAQTMRVNVPFGFRAGDMTLPAGIYKVEVANAVQRVTLSQMDGKVSGFLSVKSYSGKGSPEQGSLIFHQYGNSYFLARVNPFGADRGADMFVTKAERELAKLQPAAEEVVLSASVK